MARRVRHSQPQLDLGVDVGEQVRSSGSQAQGRARPFVRIIRYATKLLDDVDNLKGGAKFLIDHLRYCGIISGDTDKETEFEITQIKVRKKVEVGTRVKVVYPTQQRNTRNAVS